MLLVTNKPFCSSCSCSFNFILYVFLFDLIVIYREQLPLSSIRMPPKGVKHVLSKNRGFKIDTYLIKIVSSFKQSAAKCPLIPNELNILRQI